MATRKTTAAPIAVPLGNIEDTIPFMPNPRKTARSTQFATLLFTEIR